ncbi:type II toxin-antitoxin system HicB family antitoxin [Nitrospina watsonii]|uniref:HicB-like antitoxin of toxin-antitoxin system domain-containing protein n=1 Tax=Nitrospina watsonii TaxID=1323948 RepID=A0ABN8W2W4_9BACT|nr:type II toxin-antitoxin system HicB family antitoxin [Nitrospina watsonii]CAI2719040.1 conserved protein of unknown function [Nitrospina watsonii]
MSHNVSFHLKMPIQVKKKDSHFVAGSSVLDVWSQGEDRDKAIQNAQEAIALFLESCFDRGTLDDVLKECGFISFSKSGVPRELAKAIPSAEDEFEADIDIPLAINP